MLLLSAVLTVAFTAGLSQGNAPTKAQRDGLLSLIDGAAKTIYFFAWPTATYKTWSLHSVEPVPGGFDVVITLDGRSGIDDSDLWLQLKVGIRGNGIPHCDGQTNCTVVSHNAFWVAPFVTSRATIEMAAAVAKSAAEQSAHDRAVAQNNANPQTATRVQSTGSQVVAACLSNTTDALITLYFRSGDSDWQPATIAPGSALSLSTPYTGAATPALSVRYGGYTDDVVHSYRIERLVAPVPLACRNAMQYQFARQGDDLLIFKNE